MARRILHIEPTDAQWRAIDSLHNPFIQVEGESTDDGPVLLRVTEIIDDFEVAVSTIDPDGDIVTREVLNGYHQGWTAYDIEDEVDETFYERLHNPTNFATEVRLDEIGADGEYANVLQVQSTLTESTDTMTHRQIQDRAMEVLGELITDPVIVDEENWIVRAGGRDFRLSYRTVEKVTEES